MQIEVLGNRKPVTDLHFQLGLRGFAAVRKWRQRQLGSPKADPFCEFSNQEKIVIMFTYNILIDIQRIGKSRSMLTHSV